MGALKKTAGFFLIELLIVMVIVGILVVLLMPTYNLYVARAKFQNIILKAESIKSAVGACLTQRQGNVSIDCSGGGAGNGGVPANGGPVAASYIQSWATISTGVITVTSVTGLINTASPSYNYVLTPTVQPSGDITWATTGSSCIAARLC